MLCGDDDDSELGLDEEDLIALVGEEEADDDDDDDDDEDDKLLESVREQVSHFDKEKEGSRQEEENEEGSRQEEENEDDEGLLEQVNDLCREGFSDQQKESTRKAEDFKNHTVQQQETGAESGIYPFSNGSSPITSEPSSDQHCDAEENVVERPRPAAVEPDPLNGADFGGPEWIFYEETDAVAADAGQETQVLDNVQLLQHAMDKNRECRDMLESLLDRVRQRRKSNAEMQKRVKAMVQFETYCKRRVNVCSNRDVRFIASLTTAAGGKHRQRPEKNRDMDAYLALKANIKFSSKDWSAKEKETLEKEVKLQVQQFLLLQAMAQAASDTNADFDMDHENQDIGNLSPDQVRKHLDVVDWDTVASSLPGRTSGECKARWLNYEDKVINHGPWTKHEDMALLRLANAFHQHDWVTVAERLGTNRTAAQCLTRFQRSLNAGLLHREWTAEEDEQLKVAVGICGEKDWPAVASWLQGRTSNQVLYRWKSIVSKAGVYKRGRWSIEEDRRLKWAVLVLGDQHWKKIAAHVPGRTDVQCRERWRNVLDPNLKHGNWSKEEDLKLEQAVEMHGQHHWSAVAEVMKPRTDNQCWRRWMQLHPEVRGEFHREVEMKKTYVPKFGKRRKEMPDLKPEDFAAAAVPVAAAAPPGPGPALEIEALPVVNAGTKTRRKGSKRELDEAAPAAGRRKRAKISPGVQVETEALVPAAAEEVGASRTEGIGKPVRTAVTSGGRRRRTADVVPVGWFRPDSNESKKNRATRKQKLLAKRQVCT